mmetsp:Transcript_10884/g.29864  ORF Transcript_10884/g.29864 Transcript_10884/m.29864 type:complete len:242 (-) Transcript_10884:55-780(-)|eukprot:543238-Pelagomonas_calceolata.AAC.4
MPLPLQSVRLVSLPWRLWWWLLLSGAGCAPSRVWCCSMLPRLTMPPSYAVSVTDALGCTGKKAAAARGLVTLVEEGTAAALLRACRGDVGLGGTACGDNALPRHPENPSSHDRPGALHNWLPLPAMDSPITLLLSAPPSLLSPPIRPTSLLLSARHSGYSTSTSSSPLPHPCTSPRPCCDLCCSDSAFTLPLRVLPGALSRWERCCSCERDCSSPCCESMHPGACFCGGPTPLVLRCRLPV